jgi:hypothetical protein
MANLCPLHLLIFVRPLHVVRSPSALRRGLQRICLLEALEMGKEMAYVAYKRYVPPLKCWQIDFSDQTNPASWVDCPKAPTIAIATDQYYLVNWSCRKHSEDVPPQYKQICIHKWREKYAGQDN